VEVVERVVPLALVLVRRSVRGVGLVAPARVDVALHHVVHQRGAGWGGGRHLRADDAADRQRKAGRRYGESPSQSHEGLLPLIVSHLGTATLGYHADPQQAILLHFA